MNINNRKSWQVRLRCKLNQMSLYNRTNINARGSRLALKFNARVATDN
jgi:hypothetical protein